MEPIIMRLAFDEEADGMRWTATMEEIKSIAEDISPGQDPMTMRRWKRWCDRCREFRRTWGDDCFPIDILDSWNDVRVNAFGCPPIALNL